MTAQRRIPLWLALIPAVFLAMALTILWGVTRDGSAPLSPNLIGEPAPRIATAPIEGLTAPDNQLLTDGRVKIVNFWASWCVPCRVEHPQLMKLAGEGIPIVGLNFEDKDADARQFLTELGNPFAATGSVSASEARNWGVNGIPETFVLDGEGRIRLRVSGPLTRQRLEKDLRPVLNGLR